MFENIKLILIDVYRILVGDGFIVTSLYLYRVNANAIYFVIQRHLRYNGQMKATEKMIEV